MLINIDESKIVKTESLNNLFKSAALKGINENCKILHTDFYLDSFNYFPVTVNYETFYSLFKKDDNNILFDVYYKDKKIDEFKPKIDLFFRNILKYCSYLKRYSFKVTTENTFPHSSGIASSASGMSALALCIMSLEKDLDSTMKEEYFYKKASFLSRIGSGSACRSILGGINLWGKHIDIEKSTDLYSIKYPFDVYKDFLDYNDAILLVDIEAKKVSSSAGHNLMNKHSYASKRYEIAQKNIVKLNTPNLDLLNITNCILIKNIDNLKSKKIIKY